MTLVTRMAGGTALGAAMLIGLPASPAQAGYIVDLTQQGGDVVAIGNGSIDLTGLTNTGFTTPAMSALNPGAGYITIGPDASALDIYTGYTGPNIFGGHGATFASGGTGDSVGIWRTNDYLLLPFGYVSDTLLSDTATYDGATFASLGVTPGRYEWTWGSGANQNFTLVIGGAAAPESSTWAMMLVGFAGLAFAGYRRAKVGHTTTRTLWARALTISP